MHESFIRLINSCTKAFKSIIFNATIHQLFNGQYQHCDDYIKNMSQNKWIHLPIKCQWIRVDKFRNIVGSVDWNKKLKSTEWKENA